MLEEMRLKLLIKRKQSLKYQIMLILMEEHKKARLGFEHIGTYDGGNELWFDPQSWEKMRKKIGKYISNNYREKFKTSDSNYVFGLFSMEKDLCFLEQMDEHSQIDNSNNTKTAHTQDNDDINQNEHSQMDNSNNTKTVHKQEDIIINKYEENPFTLKFIMTDHGYSYQYNNYIRSPEKLQKKANLFILITLIYYIASWLIENPVEFFKKLYVFLNDKIYINWNMIPTIILVLLIFIIICKFVKFLINSR